jgi:hypothetical protein
MICKFAAVNIIPTATSMAHLMPRGADMYTPKDQQPYPFPTLFPATPEECIPELLLCLPQREELFECLTGFEKRVIVCSFPHIPFEITRSEVERFLDDPRRNAQMCPDMLALIFAAIALGGQHSVWDRSGGQWEAEAMDFEDRKGKVYSKLIQTQRIAMLISPSCGCQASITSIILYASTVSACYTSSAYDRTLSN